MVLVRLPGKELHVTKPSEKALCLWGWHMAKIFWNSLQRDWDQQQLRQTKHRAETTGANTETALQAPTKEKQQAWLTFPELQALWGNRRPDDKAVGLKKRILEFAQLFRPVHPGPQGHSLLRQLQFRPNKPIGTSQFSLLYCKDSFCFVRTLQTGMPQAFPCATGPDNSA